MRSSRTRCWRKASTPSSRCSTADWVAPQKAAVHETTLRGPTPQGREFGAWERMETMALKGKPRDMNKWRERLPYPHVHLPREACRYRRARHERVEAGAQLRRVTNQLAP